MIYIIDTGFGYIQHQLATLVHGTNNEGNHGANQLAVIKSICPTEQIQLCDIGSKPSNKIIIDTLNFISSTCEENAIICIAFSVFYNKEIDDLITDMTRKFRILVAGGNAQEKLSSRTPCSNECVIVVGSLNKKGEQASHNSIGDFSLWAPGTNIDVSGQKISGSSIATAIATAYYANHKTITDTQEAIDTDFNHIITCKY